MECPEILKIIMWMGGLCFSGFVSLSGWIFFGLRGAHNRVDTLVKSVEEAKNLKESIDKIKESIEKMENALIGSYEEPNGLVQKQKVIEKRVDELEKKRKDS